MFHCKLNMHPSIVSKNLKKIIFFEFGLLSFFAVAWLSQRGSNVMIEANVSDVMIHEKNKYTFAMHTAFYYNTSTFYENNTAIVLFWADFRQNHTDWKCVSTNGSKTLTTVTKIDAVNDRSFYCFWVTYIARCPVVENPLQIGFTLGTLKLTDIGDQKTQISLPFELPDRTPRGIVACFAPMYYEQRWQAIVVAHEAYALWGVDLQVHYVHSAISSVITLLKPFVDRKLLEIRPFDISSVDSTFTKNLNYGPIQSTEARHQVMSHNDCYMHYRESAEFIIINDPDELFLPFNRKTLYEEFKFLQSFNPTASAFKLERWISNGNAADSIETFSLKHTLKNIELQPNSMDVGKSIYNPKYAETAWIHWPGITKTPVVDINSTTAFSVHIYYNYYNASTVSDNTTTTLQNDTSKKSIEAIFDAKIPTPLQNIVDLSLLLTTNNSIIDYVAAKHDLAMLPNSTLDYSTMVKKCKEKIFSLYIEPVILKLNVPCTTVTRCHIPQRNVSCDLAIRSYKTQCVGDVKLCGSIPLTVLPKFVTKMDGCGVTEKT